MVTRVKSKSMVGPKPTTDYMEKGDTPKGYPARKTAKSKQVKKKAKGKRGR